MMRPNIATSLIERAINFFDNHEHGFLVFNILSVNIMGLLWLVCFRRFAFDGVVGALFETIIKYVVLALTWPSIAVRVISVPLVIRWTRQKNTGVIIPALFIFNAIASTLAMIGMFFMPYI